MCSGFTCSKRSLIALNILYVIVAITLISVAAYAKFASIVSSISLVSGITACGVFLLIISIVGIVAASKHYQVGLFFYMIILFLIFIVQFSIACACLAININQQNSLAKQGWKLADDNLKHQTEVHFQCCGYLIDGNSTSNCSGVKNTQKKDCCPPENPYCCNEESGSGPSNSTCHCNKCNEVLQKVIGDGLSSVGGIGLFFSFTEIVGALVAKNFRHQIDPRANIQSLL